MTETQALLGIFRSLVGVGLVSIAAGALYHYLTPTCVFCGRKIRLGQPGNYEMEGEKKQYFHTACGGAHQARMTTESNQPEAVVSSKER